MSTSINSGLSLESLSSVLNQIDGRDSQTIDKVLTLDNPDDPLQLRNTVGKTSLKNRKIAKVANKPVAPGLSPMASFKQNLTVMMSRALDPKVSGTKEMQAYLADLRSKLLGNGTNVNEQDRPIEVGKLKDLIAGVWNKADAVMLQECRQANPEVFAAFDNVMNELAQLADFADERTRAILTALQGQARQMLNMLVAEAHHDPRKLLENVKSSESGLSVFVALFERERDKVIGEIHANSAQARIEAYQAKAEAVGQRFEEECSKLSEDVRRELTDDDRKAALDTLLRKVGAQKPSVDQLKPGTSVKEMKQVLEKLGYLCAEAEEGLEDLLAEALDSVSKIAQERADIRERLLNDSVNLVNKMATESAQELSRQWHERYGADNLSILERALGRLQSGASAAVFGLEQCANNRADASSFKKQIEDIRKSFASVVTRCLDSEAPRYAALVASRQKGALADLAKGAIDNFRQELQKAIESGKSETGKAVLAKILMEAEAEVLRFAKPGEDESVEQVKARYLGLVVTLNALYLKTALDPTAAQKQAFEKGLKSAAENFKAQAQAVIDDIKGKLNGSHDESQLVAEQLSGMTERLTKDAEYAVRTECGESLVLTEACQKKFEEALATLKTQAESMLAQTNEQIRGYDEARTSFEQAKQGYEQDVLARIAKMLDSESVGGADERVRAPDGNFERKSVLYLRDRLDAFTKLNDELTAAFNGEDLLASASLREAADALEAFREKISQALDRSGNDARKLAALLWEIPTPTLTLKAFGPVLADTAFVQGAGERPVLDEQAPVLVKTGLETLQDLITTTFAGLESRGVTDEKSKDAYQRMAQEVIDEVVKTVNDAVATERKELLNEGIGRIVRKAWDKISAYVDELENRACQQTFAKTVRELQAALREAKDERPKGLTWKKQGKNDSPLALRARSLIQAEMTVERYAKLVAENLENIRKDGGVPDKAQFSNVLRNLANVRTWLERYRNEANPKYEQSGLQKAFRIRINQEDNGPRRTFAEQEINGFVNIVETTSYELSQKLEPAVREDGFSAVSAKGFESLEVLRQQVDEAQEAIRRDALEVIRQHLDADLEQVRKQEDQIGGQRLTEAGEAANQAIAQAGERRVDAHAPQTVFKRSEVKLERRVNTGGVGQLEALRMAREAERIRAKAQADFDQYNLSEYETYADGLRQRLGVLFLNVKGMERYAVRDKDGNVAGWTQDGERIIEMAVQEQLGIRRNDAFGEWYGDGTKIEGKEKKAVLKEVSDTQLTDAVSRARADFEAKFPAVVSRLPKKPASKALRGSCLFGLNLGGMTPAQVEGVKLLMDTCPSYIDKDPKPFDGEKRVEYFQSRFKLLQSPEDARWAMAVEKAIHDGTLDLEKLTLEEATFLSGILSEPLGIKTREPMDVGTVLKLVRSYILKFKDIDNWPREAVSNCVDLLRELLILNGNDTSGLDALCVRVFDKSLHDALKEVSETGFAMARFRKKNPRGVFDRNRLGDVILKIKEMEESRYRTSDDTWRNLYDGNASTKPSERRVVEMLRAAYAFGTGKRGLDDPEASPEAKKSLQADKRDLLELRRLLNELLKGDHAVSGNLGGVNVYLGTDRHGNLQVEIGLTVASKSFSEERDQDGEEREFLTEIEYQEGRHETSYLDVPFTPEAMLEKLDDEIIANVSLFGREEFGKLFAAERAKPGFETSSRLRQMCVSFFKSFANVDAAKLCFISTGELVKLAERLLGHEGDAYADMKSLSARQKAVERDLLSNAVFDETLNSYATLEVYQKYEDALSANPKDVNEKVTVPEPELVRRNETLTESRKRRLHEFASDLIQPNDTTRYDLDCKAGLSEATVLRHSLMAHKTEVQELLAMTDDEIVSFFTLKGGANQKLDAFAAGMLDLAKGLRAIRDKEGLDGLLACLAADGNPATETLLEKVSADLATSSRLVLENLQRAFQQLFVESFGKNHEFFESPVWTKTLDELVGTVAINPNKGYGGFLKEVLGSYFGQMEPTDRRRMAALTMRYATADASLGEVLGALLKGAGPVLQKLMQGLPQSALPPELQIAVADLKCNLAPIAPEAVRAHLYDVVQGSNGHIKNITVLESLGAASVGEAFLCRITTVEHPEGEECVIKMLRPEVQNRARREDRFFRGVIDAHPGYEVMLNQRFARIFDELDLTIEGANVAQGGRYDPESSPWAPLRVRSMKLHPAVRTTTNLLFLRRAPGVTYDKYVAHLREERLRLLSSVKKEVDENGYVSYTSDDPYTQAELRHTANFLCAESRQRLDDLSAFVSRWVEEVAFTGGFFHGDLHAGNIMTDDRGLTVIDYGNASQFPGEQRLKITKLVTSAGLNQPDGFFDAFRSLLSPAGQKDLDAKSKKIKSDIRLIFAKGGMADSGKRFIGALQYLQNADVELPGEVFDLIESMRRLDESLQSLQREGAALGKMAEQMERGFVNTVKGQYWFDEPLVKVLNANVGFDRVKRESYDEEAARKMISKKILDACTNRVELEKVLSDVRKLANRGNVRKGFDYRSDLKNLLALADEETVLLGPETKSTKRARLNFANSLAECLVKIQMGVLHTIQVGSNNGATTSYSVWDPSLFTKAVAKSCMRSEDLLKSSMSTADKAEVALMIGKKKLGVKSAEDLHGECMETIKYRLYRTKGGDFASLTDEEIAVVVTSAEHFCLPPNFKDLASGWKKDSNRRGQLLEVFMLSIDKVNRQIEARRKSGEPVASNAESDKVGEGCMPLLAMFFLAQADVAMFGKDHKGLCGFEKTQADSAEFKALLKAAQERDPSGQLVKFLSYARTAVN